MSGGLVVDVLARMLTGRLESELVHADPAATLRAWFDDAVRSGSYQDPGAMALATASPEGVPSVRVVLCKSIEPDGSLTFYTNYASRKGVELEANPRASVVFHWPHAGRQARVEGTATRLSPAESDAYFASRPLLSRLAAAVSPQSSVIASRADLVRDAMRLAASAPAHGIPRPAYWGGYRLRAASIELWAAGEGRLHERVRWTRSGGAWKGECLAP
jgi:pyridoxamine 5'-phosphate oxidase